MDCRLPLSPPKRILDRLTPVNRTKVRNKQRVQVSKSKLLSASEVMKRFELWKDDNEKKRDSKRRMSESKLEKASIRRMEHIETRRERARRISNDRRVWSRCKVKAEIYEGEMAQKVQQSERTLLRESIHWMMTKPRISGAIFMIPLDQLKTMSIDEVQSKVKHDDLQRMIKYCLQHYRIPQPNCSLSVERIFLSCLLIIVDSSKEPNERMYETTLGPNVSTDFHLFKELHYDDDTFYQWLCGKLLSSAQKLLISFKRVVYQDDELFSSNHLKLLNNWRGYLSLFLIVHHFHLVRSYIIVLQVLEVLQSEKAIQEHSPTNDLYVDGQLVNYTAQKGLMEKQIAFSERRLHRENSWFMYDRSFECWADDLYSQSLSLTDGEKLIVPPGFSLQSWRRFRLQVILDQYDNITYSLEATMERIGLKSYSQMIEDASADGEEVVHLNLMLFACVGVSLNPEQYLLVKSYESTGYIVHVQMLLNDLWGHDTVIVGSSAGYLQKWRRLMIQCTEKFVEESMRVSYKDFEGKMLKYELVKQGLSVEDYVEELKMSVPNGKRALPFKTLLVEHILDCLQEKRPLPLSFNVVEEDLKLLHNHLKDLPSAVLFVLSCAPVGVVEALIPTELYGFASKWSRLFAVHLATHPHTSEL